MSIDSHRYSANEAWLLFQLNDQPVHTETDGDFNVYAIMDVATGLIHGMEFVSALAEEPSEFEAKRLLNSSESKAGVLAKYLFVDSSRQLEKFARVMPLLGIKLIPEEVRTLDTITEEARTGFAMHVARGERS